MKNTNIPKIRSTKDWKNSCDWCVCQEDGGHYCLLYGETMKNMDIKTCDEWTAKSGKSGCKKNAKEKRIQYIALEDLMTVAFVYFCENIDKIMFEKTNRTGSPICGGIDWYLRSTDKTKRNISEKLLDIIEQDGKKNKKEK